MGKHDNSIVGFSLSVALQALHLTNKCKSNGEKLGFGALLTACFVLFIQCNRGYVISGLAVSLERACSFSRQSLKGEIDKPYKLPKGTRYCLVYPIPLPPLRSAAPMPLIRPLVSYQTLQAIPNGEYPYILSVSLVRFVRQECVYIYNFYPYNPYKPYKLPKGTRYCLVYPLPLP